MITLPKKWIDFLVREPETGMGYQIVDITFSSGHIERQKVVFNSVDANVTPPVDAGEIVKITVFKNEEFDKPTQTMHCED